MQSTGTSCRCLETFCLQSITSLSCSALSSTFFAKDTNDICNNLTTSAVECYDSYCISLGICVPLSSIYISKQTDTSLCNQLQNHFQCAPWYCLNQENICIYFEDSEFIAGKDTIHRCIACKKDDNSLAGNLQILNFRINSNYFFDFLFLSPRKHSFFSKFHLVQQVLLFAISSMHCCWHGYLFNLLKLRYILVLRSEHAFQHLLC